MDKKIIAVLFTAGIVVLGSISGFLLLSVNNNKDNNQKATSNEVVIMKEGLQEDVKNPVGTVSYSGDGFSTELITIKRGHNIELKNLTDKKVNMHITGPKEYQVPIDANGVIPLPLFSEEGAYLIFDTENNDIKVQLIVTE